MDSFISEAHDISYTQLVQSTDLSVSRCVCHTHSGNQCQATYCNIQVSHNHWLGVSTRRNKPYTGISRYCRIRCVARLVRRLFLFGILCTLTFLLCYGISFIYPVWYQMSSTQTCDGCFKRPYDFVINPKGTVCPAVTCDVKLEILILVHSRMSGIVRRDTLRQTWLTITKENTSPAFRHVFIVGTNHNQMQQILLEQEAALYGDIVQQNFYDAYDNLTLKNMAGLAWSTSHCKAKYILKSDEDMYVNVSKIHQFTQQNPDIDNYILGRRRITPNSVLRYPPYVEGARYLLPMKVAQYIHHVAPDTPYFPQDDVYATGMCIWKSPFQIWPFWGIETKVSIHNIACETLQDIYSIHNSASTAWQVENDLPNRVLPDDLIEAWTRCTNLDINLLEAKNT